ncbi:MAG: tRNA (N(6)-L-threonylcarbamoyladenosine(37)-C(2))-methylthiotransferase MtaB [SAR202 cluster bacterium]|nr:tRNA (N(6)-L-threonylcarbamoyladenosine(37)-C(2))-methylthiotransferase MtaB [SAR202 cluster bacterium]|tara:strand:+ start:31212 stop:32504 length:1293 start_codon:yes stop_codon:yes gene_type:complete
MKSQLHNKVSIETHGCKLNQADSGKLALEFLEAGFKLVENGSPTDIHIVNTCTVTHIADRKARRSLRAARRLNPEATIVATGCYVDRDSEALLKIPEIDIIANNQNKASLVSDIVASKGNSLVSCTLGTDDIPINLNMIRTRASIKIQEGCDQVCAYCIVPKVRGRERSIPANEIISSINNLESLGYKEIILTGTQLGTYGFDLENGPNTLHSLIDKILQKTSVGRIRVSSIQPQEITPELLEVWRDPRICPHMHIPLQSGSDETLKAMRRRYTRDQYLHSVDRVMSTFTDFSITTDIIVGFPGETDSGYKDTLDVVNRVDFSNLHVFPFSVRPGTSAAYLNEQISPEIKTSRVSELIELGNMKSRYYRQNMIGAVRPVLWEDKKKGEWQGLTDTYVRVAVKNDQNLHNSIDSVLITGSTKDYMQGMIVG